MHRISAKNFKNFSSIKFQNWGYFGGKNLERTSAGICQYLGVNFLSFPNDLFFLVCNMLICKVQLISSLPDSAHFFSNFQKKLGHS